MLKQTLQRLVLIALLSSAAYAWAEDAPVYDADNFPPQFDGQPDTGAATPAPVAQAQPQAMDDDSSNAPSSAGLGLDQRIARVEHQVNNLQSKNTASKVDSLQSDVQALRGQVEQLTRQLQQLQAQQRAMYTDMDKRIANSAKSAAKTQAVATDDVALAAPQKTTPPTKAKPADTVAAATTTTDAAVAPTKTDATAQQAQPNVAEEQQIYQTAYDLIKAKKYNDAISALQKMLQKYPTGQFAANAHYWLGELYGLLGKNDQSSTEFDVVVKNYPDSPKVQMTNLTWS